jgi:hypothetical protein
MPFAVALAKQKFRTKGSSAWWISLFPEKTKSRRACDSIRRSLNHAWADSLFRPLPRLAFIALTGREDPSVAVLVSLIAHGSLKSQWIFPDNCFSLKPMHEF